MNLSNLTDEELDVLGELTERDIQLINSYESDKSKAIALKHKLRVYIIQRQNKAQDDANAAYKKKLEAYGKAKDDFSDEYMLQQLRARIKPKQSVKITHHKENVAGTLLMAYSCRVQADNQAMVSSEDLSKFIGFTADWMTSTNASPGLIIRGLPGVGKSTLMRAITDVFFLYEKKYTMEVSALEVSKADDKRMKELVSAPMLAIDDMGTEPATIKYYGNESSPMVELLTERHRKLLFTIITTNLVVRDNGIDEIEERYGARIRDRLRELCGEIKYGVQMKSYRGRKQQQR